MYEYDPAKNQYRLTIRYNGTDLEFTLRQYHVEFGISYWHLISRSRVLDFRFDRTIGKLTEERLEGQPEAPEEFVKLVEAELRSFGHY